MNLNLNREPAAIANEYADQAAEPSVMDARRALHRALVELPDSETTRVCALLADLETAIERQAARRHRAAIRRAANYVRGVSADRRFDKASVSTALCVVSDELHGMADEAQQPEAGERR